MIHGGLFLDRRMWEPQATALADDYTVVRFDLRGYGRSSPPGDCPYRHCDDVRSVLEHLDLDDAVIVGNSFGSTVALDVAFEYPELVRGLVLAPLAPLLGWKWAEGHPVGPVLEAARTLGPDAALAAIRELPMFERAVEKPATAARVERMYADHSGWHFRHRDPATFAVPNARDEIGRITSPTRLIAGAEDVRDVHLIHGFLRREMPDADVHTIAGVGHLPNMEDPAAFDALLRGLPPGPWSAVGHRPPRSPTGRRSGLTSGRANALRRRGGE